jgi:hypothetical protein
MKRFLITLTILIPIATVFFVMPTTTDAQYGSCSEYGMAYESGSYCKCMAGYVMGTNFLGDPYCVSEDQACKDQYGYNAKSNYTGGCECRYGYVFGTDMFGNEQCVDGDNVCHDKYGYGSEYDNLSGSCECSYGYVWGDNGKCITDDQACKDQLGIHSRATYGDQCQCSVGYIIDNGKCTYGDTVCSNDHGIYASYNSLSNKCECDDGYTFDDDLQCVKKHNSAYFTLLDISDNGDDLLVQSQHDYQNYIIEYGIGCWDYAIETYEGLSLVINMGTDFSVDMFDTLVLPNHDQNCSIMSVEWTSDDSFPEEVETYTYTPPVQEYVPTPTPTYTPEPTPVTETYSEPETINENVEDVVNDVNNIEEEGTIEQQPSEELTSPQEDNQPAEVPRFKEGLISKLISFFKNLF